MLSSPVTDHSYMQQRRLVWAGLAFTIALDTAAQLCWKAAASHAPESSGMLQILSTTFRQPLFWVTIALFICMFFNWMAILSKADLSYAKPITALSCVTVSITAALWFNEELPLHRIAGIVMILCGVWFISSTRHRTIAAPAGPVTAMKGGAA
jgi:drug/metabolite transporter (DMT)-like permease